MTIGEISDVKLKYYIEIISDINKQLQIKMFKEDTEIEIKENKTIEFDLPSKEMKQDKYRIEIKKNENTQLSMEDIFQSIQIKVHSEQEKL